MRKLSSLLRYLLPQRASPSRRRRLAGLLLETLETRCVPANVVYGGGPLISNVEVVNIYYGATWKTNTNLQNQVVMLDTMAKYLVNSSYMDLIAQYSAGGYTINHGTFWGHDYVTSPPLGSNIDDTQLQNMVSMQISLGKVPANTSRDIVYMVYVEPGRVVTAGGQNSINDFYGYHSTFNDANNKPITYAIMPYSLPPNITDQWTAFQDITQTASHELVEMITDPDTNAFNGWSDPSGSEVADLGGSGIEFNKNFFLQLEWSNAANGTAVSANGSLTQPPPVTSVRAPLGLVMDTRLSQTKPTFSFSLLPNADFYQLRIDDLTTGANFVVSDIGISTSPWTITQALTPGDTYNWTVRGYSDQGVMGSWATLHSFKVPIAAPTGLTPTGNIQVLTPTYLWNSVTGASHYQVQVKDLTTGLIVVNKSSVLGTSLLSPVALKANHSYQLSVRAVNIHGVAGPWATQKFAERYDTPIGAFPIGTIAQTLPSLFWSGAAPDFELKIVDVTSTVPVQVLLQTGITSSFFTLTTPLTSGHTYKWWVSAYDANGITSAWSAPLTFTVS